MDRHFFTFKFPEDKPYLPKGCPFEILPGSIGFIDTTDEAISKQLTDLFVIGVGSVLRITAEAAEALTGNLKTVGESTRTLSFTKQTKWNCGFFNIPFSKEFFFFNPGLERIDGDLHLFARRCRVTVNGGWSPV